MLTISCLQWEYMGKTELLSIYGIETKKLVWNQIEKNQRFDCDYNERKILSCFYIQKRIGYKSNLNDTKKNFNRIF